MPMVWIPAQMRDLTAGHETVTVAGATVGQVVDALELAYPGMRERVCQGSGLRPGLAVAVDGQIAPLGLLHPVQPTSELVFLPAIGGG